MFTYIFIHIGNLILGMISIDAMESLHSVTDDLIHNLPGRILLLTCLLIHFFIALRALYNKPFSSLPLWQQLQLASGILMVLLLITHVVPVQFYNYGFDVENSYPLILQKIWGSFRVVIQQTGLLVVAWLHVCLGLHYWLKTKNGYRKHLYWIYALAVLWPTLAIIGFIQAGNEAFDYDIPDLDNPILFEQMAFVKNSLIWLVIGICCSVLILKKIRRQLLLQKTKCQLVIGDNEFNMLPGQTILNGIRFAGLAHASVCGGRARCTTCRVRVNRGMQHLQATGSLEALALSRINAPPTVRLACQAVVNGDINISPLLPADSTMKQAKPTGGISGEEKQIVAMFVDLRDSTKMSETRLPYDILFLLNEFFTQMSKSLENTGGHYAQFAGDGLMALYGLNCDNTTASRQALQGALEMMKRMNQVNQKLKIELNQPLRIGIGLHFGDAIVGSMGPPSSPNFSAIGDNINIAARLEALSKDLNCIAVISTQLLEQAKLNYTTLNQTKVPIRGRKKQLTICTIKDLDELSNLLREMSQQKSATH